MYRAVMELIPFGQAQVLTADLRPTRCYVKYSRQIGGWALWEEQGTEVVLLGKMRHAENYEEAVGFARGRDEARGQV